MKKRYNEVKPAGWSEWEVKQVNTNETPATVVTLTKGFYLGETEVTQAQWEALMGSNPSRNRGLNLPVEMVGYGDCVEFCQMLTQRERVAGRIGVKQVFRLPTEAEWEYACRAGSMGKWSFGDDESRLGDYAWFWDNSDKKTNYVATRLSNDWGLYDMHGNVTEWCGDGVIAYLGGEVSDPVPVRSMIYACRGGTAGDGSAYCRSAGRNFNKATAYYYKLGFRLALSETP